MFYSVKTNEITDKSELLIAFTDFFEQWRCPEYTVLNCLRSLAGALVTEGLIDLKDLETIGKLLLYKHSNIICVTSVTFQTCGYLICLPWDTKIHQ